MLQWLVKAALAPVTQLGESWIKHKNDKQALEHGTERAAIQSATTFGIALIGSWAGRIPLFILATSIAVHYGAVYIDSTFPSDWLNPKALPEHYREVGLAVVIALFGPAAWRALKK